MNTVYFHELPGPTTHPLPRSSGLRPDRLVEITFDAMLDEDSELPGSYLMWVNATYRRAVDEIAINALIHPSTISGDYLDGDAEVRYIIAGDPGKNKTVSEEEWKNVMVVADFTLDDFCRAALRFVIDVLGGVPSEDEEEV